MNRKTLNTILIILGVLGAVALIFFILDDDESYSWHESYQSKSEEPYGTALMQRLLKEVHSDGEFTVREKGALSKLLEKDDYRKDSKYVFVGESIYLSTDDKQALLNFIAEGNTAFLALKDIPDFIPDLYAAECGNLMTLDDHRTTIASMNFYHETFHEKYGYNYSYRVVDKDIPYGWDVFSHLLFCDSTRNLTPLGYIDKSKVNFLRISHGEGYVYLHSNPIVFTNFFMVQKHKMEYASAVFSHIEGKNVIWEELGKLPVFGDQGNEFNSPLYYIMQQPSLKYAWWLIILATVLYVFFAAKRTQRLIPVLEPKTNTSLEFVKMIASLHYQNKDHLGMARKKMKYFYFFIRSRYGIHAQPHSEEMVLRLAEKSRVPLEDVKAVFKFYRLIEEGSNGQIDASRLSNFYHTVENFYKQCK